MNWCQRALISRFSWCTATLIHIYVYPIDRGIVPCNAAWLILKCLSEPINMHLIYRVICDFHLPSLTFSRSQYSEIFMCLDFLDTTLMLHSNNVADALSSAICTYPIFSFWKSASRKFLIHMSWDPPLDNRSDLTCASQADLTALFCFVDPHPNVPIPSKAHIPEGLLPFGCSANDASNHASIAPSLARSTGMYELLVCRIVWLSKCV